VKKEREDERKFWESKIEGKIEALFYEEKTRIRNDWTVLREDTKGWLVAEVIFHLNSFLFHLFLVFYRTSNVLFCFV
jgi:hypothetical protein